MSTGTLTIYGEATQIHPYSTTSQFIKNQQLPIYVYTDCNGHCNTRENPNLYICPSNIPVLNIHCPINEFYVIPTGLNEPETCLCAKPDGNDFCSRKLYCSQLEPGVCPVVKGFTFFRATSPKDSTFGVTRCYYTIDFSDINDETVNEWKKYYSLSQGNGETSLCIQLETLHPAHSSACGQGVKLKPKKSLTTVIIIVIVVIFIIVVIAVVLFMVFHKKKKKIK